MRHYFSNCQLIATVLSSSLCCVVQLLACSLASHVRQALLIRLVPKVMAKIPGTQDFEIRRLVRCLIALNALFLSFESCSISASSLSSPRILAALSPARLHDCEFSLFVSRFSAFHCPYCCATTCSAASKHGPSRPEPCSPQLVLGSTHPSMATKKFMLHV
ncbi:hypothetical protein HDK77DRAFT_441721 [Phyllosticta capitalensis]|uniref:Secreted protein n=1 Tax=Phyllosticta capitalensis TaxID=121624 RepID=A0ABR1Z546_9PEZI